MSLTLHTSLGELKLELYCERTPRAAFNFLALSACNAYNNTIFHRSVPGFIVQGGDPSGTGRKSRSIYNNKFEDELVETLRFDRRGVLAMANSGANTNGSQFFIAYDALSQLNQTATIFGHVIHGWDTLDRMEAAEVNAKNRPTKPIELKSITIHANPFAELDN